MFSTAWNIQRFTGLGREEKGEGEDRGDLMEKNESQEERAINPVITLPSKKWVVKIGLLKLENLITNTKNQRLKI